ncbi:hypothetical protein [Chitinophaga filiformis]|uniref:Uncharacterized protein n=1 Tax=Chitinophaga filiformis TaxID=104663 RepID=A0ABY4IBT5_CHIFI|nr:hypothetical protein [Chitinophaga filiformis]UPK72488.1 hypothetical protein MYF79_14440 [Chitinophaga filiformis]
MTNLLQLLINYYDCFDSGIEVGMQELLDAALASPSTADYTVEERANMIFFGRETVKLLVAVGESELVASLEMLNSKLASDIPQRSNSIKNTIIE